MLTNQTHTTALNSSVRRIQAKVELYEGSTLLNSYGHTDDLISFEIERVGEEKFFGFGIGCKANIRLMDINRAKTITTDNNFKIYFGAAGNYITPYPRVYVTEVNRDENTNELSITTYDAIGAATGYFVSELDFTSVIADEVVSYTIREFAAICASKLGLDGLEVINVSDDSFDTEYPAGANFEGTETLREALNAIAEVTQTIYYIDANNKLVFRRLDKDGEALFNIDKSKYFSLDSSTNRRLAAITHATELGDNVTASITETGSTQFVRNNPFWDMREDIGTLLDNAIAAVGGLTINQLECEWRGSYMLECCDKISFTTKDGSVVNCFLLDDVIRYDGTLSESTRWSYSADESETADNPTTLGDALKQTFAKVDKANKEITLVASQAEENKENISSLIIDTESITASVSNVEKHIKEGFSATNEELTALSNRVDLAVTAEQVAIDISTALENGVDKVTTSTGFTFNEEGMRISKSDSEISTQITEDGMTISKNDEIVLTANNEGVQAEDLHATTYLIIGNTTRFEDFIENGQLRTGAFWIG